MPVFALEKELVFPPVELAEPDGLLAVGGDLSTERLLLAYRSGIFPWYDAGPICWWCPHPRFVLFPDELKISKSMRSVLGKDIFTFTVNKAFATVIQACGSISRKDQQSTWITEEMREAYITLHARGFAHSAEAWYDNELVGGLYGVRLGDVFFGESMFSKQTNASKFVFIRYIRQLKAEGVKLVDCQVHTTHLESLGARMISREAFTGLLREYIS